AKRLTQEILDQYDCGVRIQAVQLQDVNPPRAVRPAFNEVNSAKQEQEKVINEAEREYNRVIPEARGKAEEAKTTKPRNANTMITKGVLPFIAFLPGTAEASPRRLE
ncbi:MAG: SPFH domain-containing protein, partial [Elusimicrobiota bacterium]